MAFAYYKKGNRWLEIKISLNTVSEKKAINIEMSPKIIVLIFVLTFKLCTK